MTKLEEILSLTRNKHLSYMKKGDGVNNLDSVVREENMNQKLLFTTVTYTNTSEEELNHNDLHGHTDCSFEAG